MRVSCSAIWSRSSYVPRGPSYSTHQTPCPGPPATRPRAHPSVRPSVQVKDAGYEVEANGKLITVFSAPNYCDQMGNKGALLRFDSNLDYVAKQFEAVPHPPVRAMAYAGGMGMFGF